MFEDQLTPEPAGNGDQDDTKHGQSNGNDVAATDKSRAARCAKVKAGRENQQCSDVETRVPVGDLFRISILSPVRAQFCQAG